MISREFVYEFSNFDDISTRENDKKSRAEAFSVSLHDIWHHDDAFKFDKRDD